MIDGFMNIQIQVLNMWFHLLICITTVSFMTTRILLNFSFFMALSLNVPCISESCIEIKIKLNSVLPHISYFLYYLPSRLTQIPFCS